MRVLSKEQWEGCGDTRGGKTNTALKGVLSQNALHLILLKKLKKKKVQSIWFLTYFPTDPIIAVLIK